jgi:serine/threonine protein kinase
VSSKSVFRQSALTSGLLTQADLDQALASFVAPPSDESLSNKLVQDGRLNRWQAEQLVAGRTKFTLGPYQIIDSIGQGGMGQVFKAEHSIMGRVVAVKVLPKHKSTPQAIANFTREIRAQAQLDHANLVRAFDAGQDGNVHFLVTEYVPGIDLRRLVRRQGAVELNSAASIIYQAALGLHHAHGRGLIHRDVKPGNILVTPDGHAKVSDLGLAGYFSDEPDQESTDAKIVGTADYLSPEQILTPDRLTPTSDVYSLGCTLYYCITGKVPFPGGTVRDKARAHCQLPPLDPRRLTPGLPDGFVEVLAEMMAKDPGQRLQSMAEVARRLQPWAQLAPATAGAVPATSATVPVPRVAGVSESQAMPAIRLPAQPGYDPGYIDTPSQQSFGTQPIPVHAQETIPLFDELETASRTGPVLTLQRRAEIPMAVKVLIGVGIGAALMALGMIAILAML